MHSATCGDCDYFSDTMHMALNLTKLKCFIACLIPQNQPHHDRSEERDPSKASQCSLQTKHISYLPRSTVS